jgi:hypothetical protein
LIPLIFIFTALIKPTPVYYKFFIILILLLALTFRQIIIADPSVAVRQRPIGGCRIIRISITRSTGKSISRSGNIFSLVLDKVAIFGDDGSFTAMGEIGVSSQNSPGFGE